MKTEKLVAGFRITVEEVLKPDAVLGRRTTVVMMRAQRVMDGGHSGWVSFFLNSEGEVERKNGGCHAPPPAVLAVMYRWAGGILRDIRRVKAKEDVIR